MKRIYLIRHCKASGQESSAPLTSEGQIQAHELTKFFGDRPIDYIVSSPYDRAVSTIRPLAQFLDLTIRIDDRLRERVLSAVQLTNWMDELRNTFDDLDLRLPGGESSREAMSRGVSVIEELVELPNKNIAVVTHGNLMSLMLKHFDQSFGFNEWRQLSNPDIYELAFLDDEKRSINRLWKSSEEG